MDQISQSFENVHKFPNSTTFISSKSSIAILKIPDPLITITNYKASPIKCSCKINCSSPISTPLNNVSTHNSIKYFNSSLNYHDLHTNSVPSINNQADLSPQNGENLTRNNEIVAKNLENSTKIGENPAKTPKIVSKNPPNNIEKAPKTGEKRCTKRLKKSKTKTKTVNPKSKKCSKKLKRLKKLKISNSNTLNSTNSTQSNTHNNEDNNLNLNNTLNTYNTLNSYTTPNSDNPLKGDVINVNKSIKVKTDKCVGTYDIEDNNLDRDTLNILEHLGEAENLLKFERERRFSQIRSDYSLVRDQIEEKFHLVITCCHKRQTDLNTKFLQRLDNVEKRLSCIKLPTLKHIKKHLEFFQ